MHVCLRLLLVLGTVSHFGTANTAGGQEAPGRVPRFRESVSLDTNTTVARRLATVEEYRAAGEWDEAVEALIEVMAANAGALVPVTPGRYVSAGLYGNLLAASFPPEGLAAYRKRIDAQARQWFDAAREAQSDEPLEEVVRRAFASSVGDDALWLLGERAFEQGRFSAARQHWARLVPLPAAPAENAPGRLEATLQYPDSDTPLADVLARLILCSLFEGDVARANDELADFRMRFGESTGMLAGREGNLADILAEVARESATWTFPSEHRSPATFAGNYARNGTSAKGPDFSGRHWRAPLPRPEFKIPSPRAAFPDEEPLSHFPVVFGDVVLVNDERRIFAWNIRTGEPAWPTGAGESAVIYPTVPELPSQAPDRLVGVPRFTMSVHEGRLYARMGSPVTGAAKDQLRDLTTAMDWQNATETKPLPLYIIYLITLMLVPG